MYLEEEKINRTFCYQIISNKHKKNILMLIGVEIIFKEIVLMDNYSGLHRYLGVLKETTSDCIVIV